MRPIKAKVLIVDDEEFSLDFLQEFLGDVFEFDYAGNGRDALAAVEAGNPAVILMDVEMPGGMNGYQACRALKDNKATQNTPVIFISAHSKTEDRLKAYESGGDDYVSKPLSVEELKHKIALALASQKTRNALAEKARQATTAAMMSMREAADAGVVLNFMSEILRHADLAEIASTTLRTLQMFQIEGAVQLRNAQRTVSRNSAGACTPVEDAVLTKMAGDARIVDLGTRSAFNYRQASIIIYNMPLHDLDLYGRLKDTAVKMAEALDAHMRWLEWVSTAIDRRNKLLLLFQHNAKLSRDVESRIKSLREENLGNVTRLAESIEYSIISLGLNDKQAQSLKNLAHDARTQAQSTHSRSVEVESIVNSLFAGLDETFSQELPSAPDTGPAAVKGIELF